jgi:hypothetical protein
MAAAVLAQAPPHVDHDLGGLNGFYRNAAISKVIKKLPAAGSEMFDGMICRACAF